MTPNLGNLVVELGRLFRFGITGIVSALTYMVLTFVIVETGLAKPIIATIVGYLAAAILSYFGHLYFSFQVEPDHRKFLWRFLVTALVTFALSIFVTWLITDILGGSYRISIAVVTVLLPLINFFCSRFWIFFPLSAKADNLQSDTVLARRPE